MEAKAVETEETLESLFNNDDRLDFLAREAVRDALREHKRLGQSVVVWQDGKVVTLAPEDIPVDLTDEVASGRLFQTK